MYYTFHTTASTPPPPGHSSPPVLLGPAEALKELLDRGCTLATKPWVDNHWCLILWKLAGMVGLDPEKETKPAETKWCWPEVIRQLLYRYERELNGGSRPPLRKIANQDAPAAFPMVLCVSNIFWSPGGVTEDGSPIEPHPELEVTDGWYRLRAQIDLPMARAVRTGVIRIGRKIGVAGARLSTERKDASEILEAYNSTKLVFSGNSSHLMPWHAKLGFTRGPCISTLHSLSHDGGFVAALDLVIVEAFPVAFLETREDENGIKRHDGIRNEIEENELNEKWRRRYEMEASKLREQYDKKFSRYDGYAERLERKAAAGPPDSIDSLYDELEYPNTAASLITRISATEAGWLAQHIRKQTETSRERMCEEIEQEMRTICPPRNVMSFRVLIVQDARTLRRPADRVAQLTVWDVMGLSFGSEEDDGKRGGGFEVGQRFLVTHVNPTQASSWMGNEPGAQVFLSTSRHTRWTKIPVAKE
ncbi:hypothetical protein CPC08DRAFT_626275 [Agrocybe pediades]|nr:hypothetical protein CPC08DRAFT_626275 [Agrocybe pediades]